MDFLSNLAKTATQSKPEGGADNQQSTTDLFASAKVVAEAAQAQFNNQPEKYDKAKVAGATADILDAAKEYGKLDESQGIGKYVEQAETYLRQYDTTTTTTTTTTANEPKAEPEAPKTEPEAPKPTETTDDEPKKTGTDVTKPVDEPTEEEPKKIVEDTKPETKEEPVTTTTEETKSESVETTEAPKPTEPAAADDYVKMAEGFLNKASSDGEKSTGNDYVKMAEGLLSKAGGDGEKKDEAAGGVGDVMKLAGGLFK